MKERIDLFKSGKISDEACVILSGNIRMLLEEVFEIYLGDLLLMGVDSRISGEEANKFRFMLENMYNLYDAVINNPKEFDF